MKKIAFLFLLCFLSVKSFSQTTVPANGYVAGGYLGWSGNGVNPLLIKSNGTDRMVINGSRMASINGFPAIATDGFIGIGANSAAQGFPFNAGNTGPFSLLHLNSGLGGGVPTFGWRPWMAYGIVSTHNQDLMFFGQRQNGSGADITDVVIGWSDNSTSNSGPDNMVFNFLTDGPGGTNDLTGSAANGREIMRLTGYGNVGIGPRFNNTWQPQNTLHQHQEDYASSWMQVSNQYMTQASPTQGGPTSITPNNGLRWGILGDAQKIRNGNAFIYNQENRHLIFSTNHQNPNDIMTTQERVRITNIGAPTNLPAGYGVWNPGNLSNLDITRVSISHNPLTPVTRPLSLLHLGYNTGGISSNPNSTDGWRPWMDIGMFVTNNTDNVYIGLKDEAGFLGDRQDAVISWGDNQVNGAPPGNSGPDNFRFIFANSTTGAGTSPAIDPDGLEGMRMTPTTNNGVYTGVGGSPSFNAYSTGINPANTMEINSWGAATTQGGSSGLRFTDLNTTSPTMANPGPGVLAVNASGDVIYVPAGAGTNMGNVCGATANPLTTNWEIPLGGNNYVFTGNSLTGDRVGIGVTGCAPIAKLQVENTTGVGGAQVAGLFRNTGVNNNSVGYVGVIGISNVTGTSLLGNVGGQFNASGAANNNIGVGASATGGNNAFGVSANAINGNIWSVAGKFDVVNSSSPQNYGINSNLINGTNAGSTNYGAVFYNGNMGLANYGVMATAFNGGTNYAIFGSVSSSSGSTPPTGPNYAGYFNGDVLRTGTDNFTSDMNLKQNIKNIDDAMSIIRQLNPKSYEFKTGEYPQMNLSTGKQYGLIAQEVQAILPELVNNNIHPALMDEKGNVVTPAVNFLSMEYQQFIGIIIKGLQEQQEKIDSLEGALDDKDSAQDARLTALENAMKQCCPGASSTKREDCGTADPVNVQLGQRDVIILNQNVPNPFAEQTTITYSVPESVTKAQIIFYTNAGQVIRTVDIKTRGNGLVNVFAADLSSGLYYYTLIADGKVIDSKKMVKE